MHPIKAKLNYPKKFKVELNNESAKLLTKLTKVQVYYLTPEISVANY